MTSDGACYVLTHILKLEIAQTHKAFAVQKNREWCYSSLFGHDIITLKRYYCHRPYYEKGSAD